MKIRNFDCTEMIKKFDYGEFSRVINLLEKNKLRYFIIGGFAIDAINSEEREHEDLDMIINAEDKNILIEVFKQRSYISRKVGRIINLDKKTEDMYYNIDILLMKEFGDFYRIRGNLTETKISKNAFAEDNYVNFEEANFKIMPYEFFSSYKDIPHFNELKREPYQRAMSKIIPLCKKIEILEMRQVKRLKCDPKYKPE